VAQRGRKVNEQSVNGAQTTTQVELQREAVGATAGDAVMMRRFRVTVEGLELSTYLVSASSEAEARLKFWQDGELEHVYEPADGEIIEVEEVEEEEAT
jgi:hypothetical protein